MTIEQGTKALKKELSAIYDEREAVAITDWVFEYLTGWRRMDRVINKDLELAKEKQDQLGKLTTELMAHKPVQYVLNEAWFHGMKLYVDENVLIPRPETEELVQWAIHELDRLQLSRGLRANPTHGEKENQSKNEGELIVDGRKLQVLDVGTGSGCIPIAIKKSRPDWVVYACDVSAGALDVAKRNAAIQEMQIEFRQLNFLNESERSSLSTFDLIISNPPYIAVAEKESIDKHVIEYEPHLALFVPTEDSLVFYKHLADFGASHLNPDGFMLMEMHYMQEDSLKNLFRQKGYEAEVRKDMHGNNRMIMVRK